MQPPTLLLVICLVLLRLPLLADVVAVVPRRVLLGEGVRHGLGGAPLAAVEGRAEGDLGAEVVPVNVVAVAPLLRPIVSAVLPGALLVWRRVEV